MFQFLHAADLHIDSPLIGLQQRNDAPSELLREATRRALENLVELALSRNVGFLLIAGDLYDGAWRDFRTGLFFVACMRKLREAGIPVLVVAGNHDAANRMDKSLPLPDNVRFLAHRRCESARLEPFQVVVHGQSFATQELNENLAASYPAAVRGWFNIGLLHTALDGREGHGRYAPCSLDDLRAKEYQYWALGHVHRREVVAADPMVVFPGNTQGRHIRESGPKGCMLVSVDDTLHVTTEFVPLDVVRWQVCAIDANAIETDSALADAVRRQWTALLADAGDRPLAVRMEIAGRTARHGAWNADPRRLEHELQALAIDLADDRLWIEKVALRTSPLANAETSANLDGPLGELMHVLSGLKARRCRWAELGEELPGLESLGELASRLPGEARAEVEGLEGAEPGAALWEQVEQLLLDRLLRRGGSA